LKVRLKSFVAFNPFKAAGSKARNMQDFYFQLNVVAIIDLFSLT
jgi:hypothetical protein